eukprot:CAMPEP_0195519950 /NCGR_PEP_ID=MMETSP0794_2-20130614/15825_1 /TAXON_ID=515487 /ORGANISM="Stephanopyxis turris, Strain CCMP 815" /LENGTH=297 /DNA_ID=CAMNT_0040649201 /DNA_START=49 /DNA_END=942 /DNA_ORIENTATION=-
MSSLVVGSLFLIVALVASENCGAMRVVVSGAGGQTGKAAFLKMLARPNEFTPLGLVRSPESRDALLEQAGCPPESVIVCDVTDEEECTKIPPFDAMIIGTSAKPSPTGETNEETGRPVFGFPNGQPERVDWIGQKNQIDAALRQGKDTQVVICSSMGGTDPEHMLNQIGKEMLPDGTSTGGNILRWKRKAEVYLIESGLPYTIVHPGGLLNEAGGVRELVIGVDDNMEGTGSDNRSIPREDVAEVLVQSLLCKGYRNRSFDLRSKPEGEGEVTTDFEALISRLDGANCDYSLGVTGA